MSNAIPIIDLGKFIHGNQAERAAIGAEMAKACEEIGFMVIKNHCVDPKVIEDAWAVTSAFFDQPAEYKTSLCKDQEEYPFGYTAFGGEVLSAGKAAENADFETTPPDLKECFSIGPENPAAMMPARIYPTEPADFGDKWTAYYRALETMAKSMLQAMALGLNLPENFFEQYTDHHASAMRALNYPVLEGSAPVPGQIRASAHTDYGVLTILRSGGPGLQVSKDRNPPTWSDVPYIEDAFIINLGDLMRRWTNDKYQSTLHRVVNPPAGTPWQRRQSIAFFHNVNKDATVSVLGAEEPKYLPIIAGDFLMEKHIAATQPRKKQTA
jgi:isopenicillin N synthase-like dioxygenase